MSSPPFRFCEYLHLKGNSQICQGLHALDRANRLGLLSSASAGQVLDNFTVSSKMKTLFNPTQKETTTAKSVLIPSNDAPILVAIPPVDVATHSFGHLSLDKEGNHE